MAKAPLKLHPPTFHVKCPKQTVNKKKEKQRQGRCGENTEKEKLVNFEKIVILFMKAKLK